MPNQVAFEYPEFPEQGLKEEGPLDILAPFKQKALDYAQKSGLPGAVATGIDFLTPDGIDLTSIAALLTDPIRRSLPKLRFPKILLKDTPPESNVKLTSVPTNFDRFDAFKKGRYGDWIQGTSSNKLESQIPKHRFFKEEEKRFNQNPRLAGQDHLFDILKMRSQNIWDSIAGIHLPDTKPPMAAAKNYGSIAHEGIHAKIDELADHLSKGADKRELTGQLYDRIEANIWQSSDELEDTLRAFLIDDIGYKSTQVPEERISWMHDILSGGKGSPESKKQYRNFLERQNYLKRGDDLAWASHLANLKKSYKDIVSKLNNLDESTIDHFIEFGRLPPAKKKGNK